MRIIDTHCHAGLNWFEPVETLLHEMNTHGVSQAVLIQHRGTYDNTYLFECTHRFPGRFKVVVLLDPEDADQSGTLTRLAEQGAVGLRLAPDARMSGPDPLGIWKKAGELGLVVSCLGKTAQFAAPEFRRLVEECSHTTIVIEHLAGASQDTAPPHYELKRALQLAEFSNTSIKIPGLGEFTARPSRLLPYHHFENIPPFIEMAYDAFGPQRMMWGSDFPPVAAREGYRNALEGVRSYPALARGDDVEWVMGKTAARVWGFGEQ